MTKDKMGSEERICAGCIYDGATDTFAMAVCMGCDDGDCYRGRNE